MNCLWITKIKSDGCLGPLEKTLSGSQEVMGRVTNNSRKFLMLGKLSVLLRADMAVWGLSSMSVHLCLHLFISRSNSIGELEGQSDWYFVSRTLATSSSVTWAAGTNPGIRCCSKMTCCWFGPNFRLRSSEEQISIPHHNTHWLTLTGCPHQPGVVLQYQRSAPLQVSLF